MGTLKSSHCIEINPFVEYTEEQKKQINVSQILQSSQQCNTAPFKPYPVGPIVTNSDRRIAAQLSHPKVAKNLTDIATTFGADETIALSAIVNKLNNAGFGGINTINTAGGSRRWKLGTGVVY